jgi:hypothetical protein
MDIRKKFTSLKFWVKLLWIPLFVLLIWIIWRYRFEILTALQTADYSWLLAALAWYLLAVILSIASWHAIVHVFAPNITWRTNTIIYLSTFASRRLPGTVWYIGGRMAHYKPLGLSHKQSMAASGIEWVVNIASGCIVGLAMLPLGFEIPLIYKLVLACLGIASFIIVSPPILKWIMRRLKKPIEHPLKMKHSLLWLFISIGMWLTSGLTASATLRAFTAMELNNVFYVIGAWSISGAAGLLTLLLPSSFGISEISFVTLLSYSLPLATNIIVVIFLRILITVMEFLLYAIFNLFITHKN